ncbi:MAG: MgtC/SapB family protein [Acetanaerobacterium sp.]
MLLEAAKELLQYLKEVNLLSTFVRLFLAVILGGVIGMERGRRKQAAGFRTHILVCVGATLAMITNQYIFQFITDGVGDPARIGAQVISGIGFLGAGTILITGRQQIKGLTTAAGLWASAAMGLALGIGFYSGALIGCLFIVFVITFLHRFEERFYKSARVVRLYIEIDGLSRFKQVLSLLRECYPEVDSVELLRPSGVDPSMGIFVNVGMGAKQDVQGELENIRALDGVIYVEEMSW